MPINWKLLDQTLSNLVIVDRRSWDFIIRQKKSKTHHQQGMALYAILLNEIPICIPPTVSHVHVIPISHNPTNSFVLQKIKNILNQCVLVLHCLTVLHTAPYLSVGKFLNFFWRIIKSLEWPKRNLKIYLWNDR